MDDKLNSPASPVEQAATAALVAHIGKDGFSRLTASEAGRWWANFIKAARDN